jgi:hypothetical protein
VSRIARATSLMPSLPPSLGPTNRCAGCGRCLKDKLARWKLCPVQNKKGSATEYAIARSIPRLVLGNAQRDPTLGTRPMGPQRVTAALVWLQVQPRLYPVIQRAASATLTTLTASTLTLARPLARCPLLSV